MGAEYSLARQTLDSDPYSFPKPMANQCQDELSPHFYYCEPDQVVHHNIPGIVVDQNLTTAWTAEYSEPYEYFKTCECIPELCTCIWCWKIVSNLELHTKTDCQLVPVLCPNGCGVKLPRKELRRHMCTLCPYTTTKSLSQAFRGSYCEGIVAQLQAARNQHTARDCGLNRLGFTLTGNEKELTPLQSYVPIRATLNFLKMFLDLFCMGVLYTMKIIETIKTSEIVCGWCQEIVSDLELHTKTDCQLVPVLCPNGCGDKLPRKELTVHMRTMCNHVIRQCEFKEKGCTFIGNVKKLAEHAKRRATYHSLLMKKQSLGRKLTQEASSKQQLCVSDIVSKLDDVTNYFSLGLRLEIKTSTLKRIELDHSSNERRLTEVIDHWLSNDPKASLEKLSKALKEIGHKCLADQIRTQAENQDKPCQESSTSTFLGNVTKGIRKVWGAIRECTAKTIRGSFSFFGIHLDEDDIRRKGKTNKSTGKFRWWFCVKADDSVLKKIDEAVYAIEAKFNLRVEIPISSY